MLDVVIVPKFYWYMQDILTKLRELRPKLPVIFDHIDHIGAVVDNTHALDVRKWDMPTRFAGAFTSNRYHPLQ